MKLHSLRIEPNGFHGWSSEHLFFGDQITELYGPNGCGKTPLMQAVVFALGYPVTFRDDVYQHCSAAVLTIQTSNETLTLTRRIVASQFDVEAQRGDETTQSFYFEKDYSKFLLELFGLQVPTLTTNGGDPCAPYMATILPIFYLDQDQSYTSAYRAPISFIKDQYAEMMRMVFGLSPKHSFEQKKILVGKKKRLDQVDHAIVVKRTMIENLTKEHGTMRRPLHTVEADLDEVKAGLSRLKASRSAKSDAHSAIDELIDDKLYRQREIFSEVGELQTRIDGFSTIEKEIQIEINTLSLNEEARRLFSSFKDICANAACGLFLGSSDSYGKNLLYLRDQVKDLHRNTENQRSRVSALKEESAKYVEEIALLEKKRDEIVENDEFDTLVEAIGELTRKAFDLQTEIESLRKLDRDEQAYVEMLNERERLQNEIASMGGTAGESDLRAISIRAEWRGRVIYWLDVLKTINVSRELSVDSDFSIIFGAEKISQFKGSTLTRVVLAIHTATVEVYTRDPAAKMRFMILDTPRQQDIDREDLAHYISELKDLARKQSLQIIFSTTNYHYSCGDFDEEWVPHFPGPDQKMFLGMVSPDGRALFSDSGNEQKS